MSTKRNENARKLSFEILIMVAICFVISITMFCLLLLFTSGYIQEYLFYNDILLDDYEQYKLDIIVVVTCFVISVILFVVFFLILFKRKITYIKTITNAINNLRNGDYDHEVDVKGNNELTELAKSINYFTKQEKLLKEKEKELKEEKEQLIKNLSHDIRTPLTSIISYTELFLEKDEISKKEKESYCLLVLNKTKQIKDLTDILLDYKRELIYFDDVTLLFKQLSQEFLESIEEEFKVNIDLSLLSSFSASFDINELRRIFDNLASNIIKYADNKEAINLKLIKNKDDFQIIQNNRIKNFLNNTEGHKIGINSIKHILKNYNGTVSINKDSYYYEIIITFKSF